MIAIGNLAVLSVRMTVSDHDATILPVLLLYSVGAGVAGRSDRPIVLGEP